MDRVEYAHSIDTGGSNFDTLFVNYFDQLMGLYGFIQPRNYEIRVISSDENSIFLDIKFYDEESAVKITDALNLLNHSIQIYGRSFMFDMKNVSSDRIQMQISS